ncbi:MAG: DUF3667 domain-containing protein [Pedobacter sp.]|nr:DUF3667 domain-containing protein [Chitinophagaceae bacterium]
MNCNALIYGRFCHVCGQQNLIPKENFLHLLRHFIEDITHFDGKFFDTLKYLLLRPGFLSYEYMRGRRFSYLNPIRMYVFTSAIFFLVFFSVNSSHEPTMPEAPIVIENKKTLNKHSKDSTISNNSSKRSYTYKATEGSFTKKGLTDSFALVKKQLENSIAQAKTPADKQKLEDDLEVVKKVKKATQSFTSFIGDDENLANAVKAKKKKSNNFFNKIFGDREQVSHNLPKVMFITLPLMALILQLFYRKLKQFYYVNHIIFILHLYVAIFLILLIGIGLDYFDEKTNWAIFSYLDSFVKISAFFYTYKAMRNFYQQRRFITFVKCFGIYIFFTFILGMCSAIFNHIHF